MEGKRTSRIVILVLPLTVLLTTLACLSFGRDSLPGQGEGAEEGADAAGTYSYSGLGLESVESYAATFETSFIQEGDDDPTWTYTLEILKSEDGLRRALSIEGVSQDRDLGDVTVTTVGDMQYMTGRALAGVPCLFVSEDLDLGTSLFMPDELLASSELGGIALVAQGSESVARQAGMRYTFEADTVGAYEGVTGEIVVARDGDFVLRYDFSGDAPDTIFGEGESGRLTWHFEVTDLSPRGAVEVPQGCELEVPVMDDATNLARLPGLIAYETQTQIEDVVSFYEKTLDAEGWGVFNFPATQGDATVLTYAREGEVVSVSITPLDKGAEVQIFLEDR